MPLMQWTNGHYVPRGLGRDKMGCDAYLVAPGPSLAHVDVEALRDAPAFVMAINTAYPAIRRPDAWVGMDAPDCYQGDLPFQPFTKIFGSRFSEWGAHGMHLKECPMTYFSSGGPGRPWEIFTRPRLDQPDFIWAGNTFFMALHLLAWMGAEKIILVGCDFGGSADYHDGRVLTEALRNSNKVQMIDQANDLALVRWNAQNVGVQIVSASPDSAANRHLEYVPLASCLEQSRKRFPDTTAHVRVHAYVADNGTWLPPDGTQRGVLTGADANTQWMIPWWYGCLRKHNPDLAVVFADFGMTDEMRNWCAVRGTIIEMPESNRLQGWFKKPSAILLCGFAEILWLDTDCEVRGSLDEIWQGLGGSGLLLAEDGHNPSDLSADAVNSGAVLCRHGEPIIETWARACLEHDGEFRGDQEVLNSLGLAIPKLAKRWNWLRLDGPPSADAVIVHHTGPVGKQEITRRMGRRERALVDILNKLYGDRPLYGAEIGVLSGVMSANILHALPKLTLWMVDTWGCQPPAESYVASGDGIANSDRDRLQDMRDAAERTDFARPRRRFLRGDAVAMADEVPDRSLDFVFFDADHSKGGLLAELEAWAPKVKAGGLLGGHDWEHPDYPGFGVRQAVDEFRAQMGITEQATPGCDLTWWLMWPGRIGSGEQQNKELTNAIT